MNTGWEIVEEFNKRTLKDLTMPRLDHLTVKILEELIDNAIIDAYAEGTCYWEDDEDDL